MPRILFRPGRLWLTSSSFSVTRSRKQPNGTRAWRIALSAKPQIILERLSKGAAVPGQLAEDCKRAIMLARQCEASARGLLRKEGFKGKPRFPFNAPSQTSNLDTFVYCSSLVVRLAFDVLRYSEAVRRSGGKDGLAAFRLGQTVIRTLLLKERIKTETQDPDFQKRRHWEIIHENKPDWPRNRIAETVARNLGKSKPWYSGYSTKQINRVCQDLPPLARPKLRR